MTAPLSLSVSPGEDAGSAGPVPGRGLRGAGQHVHGAGGRRLPAQDHDTHVGSPHVELHVFFFLQA